MKRNRLSRRRFIAGAGAAIGTAVTTGGITVARGASKTSSERTVPFSYCFNTSTIRGQKLSLDREIEITAKAGYGAIEPWVDKIHEYAKGGGNLNELRRRISNLGLTVESAISFSRWIVDDDGVRAKAFEQNKRDMDVLAQIGGKRIAAPPAGATRTAGLDLMKAAERYRALLELGDEMGIVPQVEVWGSSKNLHRLGQAMFVVIESGHPKACLLPDVYHTYKGGSDFNGLKLLSPRAIQVFHLNDYPADPPRETIGDRDRVFPGDGIAPLTQILRDLHANGNRAVLSLELFNPTYWKQDPLAVAKAGLAKMKAAVNKALGGSYSLAAKPLGKQSSDAGASETDSLTATEKQTKPAAKSAVAGYGYVASKNSKVFHKPGCRWATRIKPENLVGYSSKDEVIKAGKRPCKQCKP
ncbi:MAG: TIM barrel protein [Planctomycetota bacterium]